MHWFSEVQPRLLRLHRLVSKLDSTNTKRPHLIIITIIRPHRSTMYVDAAYCYWLSSTVCRSVCHTSEPCKNGCTDWDAVWVEDSGGPKEPCIRWESTSLMGRGNFEGGKGRPIGQYRDTVRSSVQKRPNRSRCRLGCGLRWAQWIMCYMAVQLCWQMLPWQPILGCNLL